MYDWDCHTVTDTEDISKQHDLGGGGGRREKDRKRKRERNSANTFLHEFEL